MSERRQEEDYFARIEREKKEKLKAKVEAEEGKSSLEARKELHWNRCGKCGADMNTHAFRGVEIEVCPDCGAVLLDRGELEELAGEDRTGMLTGLLGIFGQRRE